MIVVLKGKTVVVTGGLGTLGRAVVQAAAAQGAQVVSVDCVDGEAPEGAISNHRIDLLDGQAAAEGMAAIAQAQGGIDALVNVAGGFRWETVMDGSVDTWDFLYQLNVRTAVNACRGAIPHIPSAGGRIVNISAAGSVKADMGLGAYAASKAGVSKLTEALAAELKAANVTVNAVMPSIIDTAPNRADMPDADFETWVKPSALADVIVFLLSPAAEAVTGALIPVTGRV